MQRIAANAQVPALLLNFETVSVHAVNYTPIHTKLMVSYVMREPKKKTWATLLINKMTPPILMKYGNNGCQLIVLTLTISLKPANLLQISNLHTCVECQYLYSQWHTWNYHIYPSGKYIRGLKDFQGSTLQI